MDTWVRTHTPGCIQSPGDPGRAAPSISTGPQHGPNAPAPASSGAQHGSRPRLYESIRAASVGTLTMHHTGPGYPELLLAQGAWLPGSAQSTCWRPSAGLLGCKEATVPACRCPHVGPAGLLGWPVRPAASCQMPRLRKGETGPGTVLGLRNDQ